MYYLKKNLFKKSFSAYHLVDQSPWPLMISISLFFLAVSGLKLFLMKKMALVIVSFFFVCLCFYGWQKDVLSESIFEGSHTSTARKGLKLGMLLFILSELLFFFSFFWSYFLIKTSVSPMIDGWPPAGIQNLSPLGPPLLGTLTLISSGISVTWAHHSVLEGKWKGFMFGMLFTVILGIFFTALQVLEYKNASFTMADSAYGSLFFIMTGFHGIHVIVGSLFLLICMLRSVSFFFSFSKNHHIGLEFAIWYWHFVDVIWLFLYVFLYFE